MTKMFACIFFALTLGMLRAETSEITINLTMDSMEYVSGERVRAVVNVANASPYKVSVGYSNSQDRVFVEVFRSLDRYQLERISTHSMVAPFMIKSNEGQKLEVFLGDHYGLRDPRRYLARPVLVHDGMRYEGQMRAFDIVPGLKAGSAMQMFANKPGLRREFTLLTWSRKNTQHIFLSAFDAGTSDRKWVTTDLGPMMKINKPSVTILESGEVIVLHRYDRDSFLRSTFWSLPNALEFRGREIVRDPETAGAERVKELYKESGGVKPKAHSWWKFWE